MSGRACFYVRYVLDTELLAVSSKGESLLSTPTLATNTSLCMQGVPWVFPPKTTTSINKVTYASTLLSQDESQRFDRMKRATALVVYGLALAFMAMQAQAFLHRPNAYAPGDRVPLMVRRARAPRVPLCASRRRASC